MFVAFPKNLCKNITNVSPLNSRVQAIILSTADFRLLIINTYFPTDPGTVSFDETELVEILMCINEILENEGFDHVITLGDINCDFSCQYD